MTNPDTLRALDNVIETLIQMDEPMVTRRCILNTANWRGTIQAPFSSFRC